MNIKRQRLWIHRDEVVDSVEVWHQDRLKTYAYTYKYLDKNRGWCPIIRWDNISQEPHVDKYDTNNSLAEQRFSREKNLNEVLKLVNAFRRNLLSMDLSRL